jgi:tetratricopeptide (TPR) repeat protein
MEVSLITPTVRATPTLSLCMIVRDEAGNLADCLDSVVGFVDELVILDTGSTDRTVEIALEYGAKVPRFVWCDDFSLARNASLQYVTGDWVLVLDADERLTAEIKPTIVAAMQNPEHLVINLLRQEIGATQSPYSLVSRLFRRHPAIEFRRPYHAMIDDSVEALLKIEAHWKVVNLEPIALLHDGYRPDLIHSRDKFTKARTTMEGFLAENPNDPYVCSKLGALYCDLGLVAEGKALLERGLAAQTIDASTCYELHYHLASVYTQADQVEAADEQLQLAIAQPIPDKLKLGAIVNWGALRQTHDDFETAAWIYGEAIAIDPTCAIAHANLGLTYKSLSNFEAAIDSYQQAINLNPHNPEPHQNLGVALMKLGRIPESLASFKTAIALYKKANSTESERLTRSLSEMGFEIRSN